MTVSRTFDTKKVTEAVRLYSEEILGFDPDQWLKSDGNVALINEKGDISLFERQWRQPNTVYGHYFFKSRGKSAITIAQEMLKEIFSGKYDVEVIVGLTPVEHKGAIWLNSRLGFKSYGDIDTEAGLCRFVLLTKQEWENNNG